MKKFYLFVLIIFIGVALAAFFGFRRGSPIDPTRNSSPTPTLMPSVYRGINLDEAPADSVLSFFGSPVRTIPDKDTTTYIFPSANPNLNISVEINSDKSIRKIMEPTPPTFTYSDMVSALGVPRLALYGTLENLGFRLFVYPETGTAVLANPETGETKMRWYFPRMTQQQFLQTLGEGYSTTYDPRKP